MPDGVVIEKQVPEEWVDYNGHMNDAAYAKLFSWAVDGLIEGVGADEEFRSRHSYSIYTLEAHICYLRETYRGESLRVYGQLLDWDEKRMHLFFSMEDSAGRELATSEQMIMGVDTAAGRGAPFPDEIRRRIEALAEEDRSKPRPPRAGRRIGIRRE